MDGIVEIVIQIIIEVIQSFLEAALTDLVKGELFTSENWEIFGALGAFAWWLASLGRIKWDAWDRRAIASGVVLFFGILGSMFWVVFAARSGVV